MLESECHEVGQCGDEQGSRQVAGLALGWGAHLPREQEHYAKYESQRRA